MITYDPRNFDPEDVTPLIEEINELVKTQQGLYIRKAALPHAVIWMLVGFAAGHIVAGFFYASGRGRCRQGAGRKQGFLYSIERTL